MTKLHKRLPLTQDDEEILAIEEQITGMSEEGIYRMAMSELDQANRLRILANITNEDKFLKSKYERVIIRNGADNYGKFLRDRNTQKWELGKRIAEARLWAGMRRSEMAEKMEIGVSAYTHYEFGRSFMNLNEILLFQLITHIDLNWLIRTTDGYYTKKFYKPCSAKRTKYKLRRAPTLEIIGKRLKLLRMRMGYSRKEMAYFFHVGERAYGYYEQGLRFMNRNQLAKLRLGLGVDLNQLFACTYNLDVKYYTAPYIRCVTLHEYIPL